MTSRFIPQLEKEFPYLSFSHCFWDNIKYIEVRGYGKSISFDVAYKDDKLYINGRSVGVVYNNDETILNEIIYNIINIDDKKFRRLMKHAYMKLLERQSNYQVSQDLYTIFSSLPGSAEYEAAKKRFEDGKK